MEKLQNNSMQLNEFIKQLKSLQIQGAKEIAIESLKFLKPFCVKYGFGKKFEMVAKKIEKVRPTAVVLYNCLEILRREKSLKTIAHLIAQLEETTLQIAQVGQPLIPNKATIMTYCHSSEALAVVKKAFEAGKRIEVVVAETRPKLQGVKTAKELVKEGIPTTLITDNARGVFVKECDLVLVGCDALRKEGVVNKIGTYTLAILAKVHGKPFYVVGDTFKLDKRKKIVIEERPTKEILEKQIKGLQVRNPAFDITPWKYVSKVVTEKGIFSPRKILRMLRS
jgi:eIF-2B alpha/beta/delta-like uncharacterized protein